MNERLTVLVVDDEHPVLAEYLEKRDTYEPQGLYYLLIKPYEPQRLIEIVQRAAESARLKRVMSSLTSELGARTRAM